MKKDLRRGARRRDGEAAAGWIVLDYGDVMVHAFTAEQREVYDLEKLWADAPMLAVEDGPDFAVTDVRGAAATRS